MNCKLVSIPDPQLIKDPHTRQLLLALRNNVQALATCFEAFSQTSTTSSTATSTESVPTRAIDQATFSAVSISGTTSTVSLADATDLASAIALGNASKVIINQQAALIDQLITQHNQLVQDRDALATQVKAIQAQLALVIKANNS
ncbi:MAG: hypothetical protein ACH34X_18265 [Thiolinea sp.]